VSHNIATKSKQEQEAIQYDLMSSYWAYKERRGFMSKPEKFKYIHQHFTDATIQDHLIQRYEYYKTQ
jgi:hypothetical protein